MVYQIMYYRALWLLLSCIFTNASMQSMQMTAVRVLQKGVSSKAADVLPLHLKGNIHCLKTPEQAFKAQNHFDKPSLVSNFSRSVLKREVVSRPRYPFFGEGTLNKLFLSQLSRNFSTANAAIVLQQLGTSISSFADKIQGKCIYVDKTEQIYELFKDNDVSYFLSRPRCFGKSLFVSTLKELFSGNRELFKGLWIDESNWKWEKYPVISLDFGGIGHDTDIELKQGISWKLSQIGKAHEIDLMDVLSIQAKFKLLVTELAKKYKGKVVILIDEYDKPILDHIHNPKMAEAQREVLKSFYDPLKSLEKSGFLRALFITGVTKFAGITLFSGLNNLEDLTLDPRAATLTGYTQQEIRRYFMPHIQALAKKIGKSEEQAFEAIESMYNGYKFSEEGIKVYNPFSLSNCLEEGKLDTYWITSGTPSFLIKILRERYFKTSEKNSTSEDKKDELLKVREMRQKMAILLKKKDMLKSTH